MGKFENDGDVGASIHWFKLEKTDLIATVGINYELDTSRDKAHRIRLAITVSNKEQKEVFESIDSAEATTLYRKGWNLAVTRNVRFDDLVYTFTLRCWDTGGFAGKRPFL